jgi:hypothetical protein
MNIIRDNPALDRFSAGQQNAADSLTTNPYLYVHKMNSGKGKISDCVDSTFFDLWFNHELLSLPATELMN